MPEDSLKFLGRHIRAERVRCNLTQQELADQSGLAVKTVQDIEKGRKNPSYETLSRLIERLGISPNVLFQASNSIEDEELQRFMGKFKSCSRDNQQILLNTLDFLTEHLLDLQQKSESNSSE